MNNIVTADLSEFGSREIEMVIELLNAYNSTGYPEMASSNTGLKLGFNKNSGNVWLESDDYDCAMINLGRLELFLSTPHNGHEGFALDLANEADNSWHIDDLEYILPYVINESSADSELTLKIKSLIGEQS